MTIKKTILVSALLVSCGAFGQEYSTVPPSFYLNYDGGNQSNTLLSIGHKPVGKDNTFAGIYFESRAVSEQRKISSVGIIAFNNSLDESPDLGSELSVAISKVTTTKTLREGLQLGLYLSYFPINRLSIGAGGDFRFSALSYKNDMDGMVDATFRAITAYEISKGFNVHFQLTHYATVNNKFAFSRISTTPQIGISLLF